MFARLFNRRQPSCRWCAPARLVVDSPKQILLINLPTDSPEMTIAGVNLDLELVQAPRGWDIGFIRRFMIVFGLSHKPAALFAKTYACHINE
jgi:hypothetical protein